jgi:hypothetical protein
MISIFFKIYIFTNENLILKEKFISNCWIDNNKFPEAQKIFNSRSIIKKELEKILTSDQWGIWSSDYKTTPIFTKMTDEEIIKRLASNSGKIGSTDNPSWRLFGLILDKKELPTAKLCPNTIKILRKYSDKILNAGFSILEPGCYIGSHQDFNSDFYRLHIPLIIPKINKSIDNIFVTKEESKNLCVLQVEDDYRLWKDDDYFIFDDTCMHDAWNPSDEIRIVLLVDLLKN